MSLPKKALLRRSGWGLADQAISSLGNIAVMILAARALTPRGFGAFSLAFTTYVLLLGIARSVTSDPLTVRYSAAESTEIKERALRQSMGLLCFMGLLAGSVTGAIGAFLSGEARITLLSFAIVVPGLLIQDGWRLWFFTSGRPAQATANDATWTALQFVFIAFVLAKGTAHSSTLVLAWGLAGNVAALIGGFQAGIVPSIHDSASWVRSHRDLIPPFLLEFLATRGAQQAVLYIVAMVAGLGAVGALRGAEVILGPLNTLFLSARVVFLPEGVRLAGHRRAALLPAMALLSKALMLCVVGWGGIVLFIPRELGVFLLGESWSATDEVLAPMIVVKFAAAATMGAVLGLRALAYAKRSANLRISLGLANLIAGFVGVTLGGAYGAALGMALLNLLGATVWWKQFQNAALAAPTPLERNEIPPETRGR